MTKQSNAIRRLEEILTDAVDSGNRDQLAGTILLGAMKLEGKPDNLVDFYELLNKAEEEAKSIRRAKIDRFLQTIQELQQVFIVNSIWSEKWHTFANHIENRGVLNTLDALADFFDDQNPSILLESDFLDQLSDKFEELLNEIEESNLDTKLKTLLTRQLRDIRRAIRRYHIDGTEGLEKSVNSAVVELVRTEPLLKEEDKNNDKYKSVKAWLLGLLLYIAPTPYDIIGAAPDIYDFWVPRIEELVQGHKKIEQIVDTSPTIQDTLEKAAGTFDRQPQKSIAGSKEMKALPASKENIYPVNENKN